MNQFVENHKLSIFCNDPSCVDIYFLILVTINGVLQSKEVVGN